MNNENKHGFKRKTKTIILIIILIILGLCSYFVYDKIIKNSNGADIEDNMKATETEKSPLDKFGEIKAFGVIEKQNQPNDVTMEIVAYTTDNKIVNFYTIQKEFLKNIITEGDIKYHRKNVNIDYYENKLYIELHNQLYAIDLKANAYNLDKIDVALPNNDICYGIDVVDGVIYFKYYSENAMYNISSKEVSNLPANIENFIIKKDTKQMIYTDKYATGNGQGLYWASLSDLNSPNLIYKSNDNSITYFNYYNDNVVFAIYPAVPSASNDPNRVKIYNLTSKKTKEPSFPSNFMFMIINNELYYTHQISASDDNHYVTSLTLKIYKYNDSANLIYTFNTGPGGNYAEYVGSNKIMLIDNNVNGKDIMIDTSGQETSLTVTNLDGSTYALDLNSDYKTSFEYAQVSK